MIPSGQRDHRHEHTDHVIPYQGFVGIAWGSQTHQVCVLDRDRHRVGARSVEHEGVALAECAAWLTHLAAGEVHRVAVAIAMPRGAIVELLVERGFHVFAINPKQLDRFRDRHTVAGAKDDRRDACVLADSLRTDRPSFRQVHVEEPHLLMVRELSRTEEALLTEFRRATNQLREQLHRFYAPLLQLCPAADEPWLWDLLELAPTPAHAAGLPAAHVAGVLKTHRIRRVSTGDVLKVVQAPALPVAPGTAEAASAPCALLLPCIRVLAAQLQTCAHHVETLLTALGTVEAPTAHPSDMAIIRSLPGVGRKITAWLFAEAAQPLAERDYQMLRTQGGVAPVTKQRGKRRQGVMRRGCNPRLRNALYHMAHCVAQRDAYFASVYAALKAKGQSHGRAIRSIGDRLLRMLVAMLRNHTLYDPSYRQPVLMER
jgi:transposase